MEGEEQTIKKLILFLSFLPLFVDTSSTSFRIQFRSNFGTTSFSTLLCGFSLPSSTPFFVAVALSWRNRKSGGVDVSIHGQIESRAKPFSFENFFFLCDIFSRANAHACTFLLPRNFNSSLSLSLRSAITWNKVSPGGGPLSIIAEAFAPFWK